MLRNFSVYSEDCQTAPQKRIPWNACFLTAMYSIPMQLEHKIIPILGPTVVETIALRRQGYDEFSF